MNLGFVIGWLSTIMQVLTPQRILVEKISITKKIACISPNLSEDQNYDLRSTVTFVSCFSMLAADISQVYGFEV